MKRKNLKNNIKTERKKDKRKEKMQGEKEENFLKNGKNVQMI